MRIMKSLPEQKEESTTSAKTNLILSSKENSCLFNHIDKLAADHDVTVSQTMIKVTYKKPSREYYASRLSENGVNFCDESTVNLATPSSVKKPVEHNKKNQSAQADLSKSDMYNSDFVLVPGNIKSPNMSKECGKTSVFHSTPKQNSEGVDKKKEYINGLNLVVDLSKCHIKNTEANGHSPIKVRTTSSSAINSTDKTPCQSNSSTKNQQKNVTDKKLNDSGKLHSNSIKFLKGVTLVKLEDSINSQHCSLGKKSEQKSDPKKLNSKPKKDTSDNGSVIKSVKKVEGAIKRKIKSEENTFPNKKIKKIEGNSQDLKKKLLNTQSKAVVRDKKIKTSEKDDNSVKDKEKSEENSSSNVPKKKEILLEDPTLPSGWKRLIHTRHKGSPNEKHVVYISSPQGKKFQFRWKLRRFLEKTKSPLSADQFYFGLYGRRKPYVPVTYEEKLNNTPKSSSDNEASCITMKTKSSNSPVLRKSEKGTLAIGAGVKSPAKTMMSEGKQILLFDPDLPYGWRRIINSSSPNGKLQVHIISPDGRIFRRKYRLLEYLSKHQFTHSLDRFYFGLYPKKDQLNTSKSVENGSVSADSVTVEGKTKSDVHNESDIKNELNTSDSSSRASLNTTDDNDGEMFMLEKDVSQLQQYGSPMYEDPNLPEGWKRFIKVRACGESAGKMEVIIVSPDGKRHRSKGNLESYLKQNNLSYKADDFDFSVFGKGRRRSLPQRSDSLKDINLEIRRKPKVASDRPVPDFDINSIKHVEPTKEGKMINEVSGIMINCGLSSARSERRLRLPRREHEKIVKDHLNSEGDISNDGCDVPTYWIQRLVKCRSDFRILESEAAATIAEKTKEFLKEISSRAFKSSQHPEEGLKYKDVADIVENSQCLSPLKELIPKKITYKEYVQLNRPKQFMSFT